MGTVHKHSLFQILIIISATLLIIAELSSDIVADICNTSAIITIGIEVLCEFIFRKRLPRDPLTKFHRFLDVICAYLIISVVLLKCIDIISYNISKYSIIIGGGFLFALTFIGFYIYYKVIERDAKLQKELDTTDRSITILRDVLNENYASLDDFLTKASATENNPTFFKENFNNFFNISTNKKDNIMGNLLDVVNENYYHIIDQLKADYPNLIYEELALCAMICMGFSSSSIGIIFGNTKASSIYNRRYRLRKKLNIPQDIQIETFLHNTIEMLKSPKR